MTQGPTAAADSSPTGTSRRLDSVLAILGALLVGTGIAAVFLTDSDGGAAALLAVGTLLFVLGAAGDRLESIRFGDLEMVLRRKSSEAASRGDLEAANALERAADTLARRAGKTARSYQSLRGNLPSGSERTSRMDAIVKEARGDAHAPDLDQQHVLSLLWTGSEGARVWALAVLQERPELATVRAILEAVLRPDHMFDQYYALLLAEKYTNLPTTGEWDRRRLTRAVRFQYRSGQLGQDRDSLRVARRVLGEPAED
jgi:hypothetical protein